MHNPNLQTLQLDGHLLQIGLKLGFIIFAISKIQRGAPNRDSNTPLKILRSRIIAMFLDSCPSIKISAYNSKAINLIVREAVTIMLSKRVFLCQVDVIVYINKGF